MNRPVSFIIGLMFLICASFSAISFLSAASYAQDGGCEIEATKSAPGAGSYAFEFEGITPGGPIEFTLADGETTGGPLPQGLSVTIFEAPQNGYRLGGLECESGSGIVITNFDGGFNIECVDESDGNASCIVRNVPIVSPIPTLSEWGIIAMAGALGAIGLYIAIRRRMARA